MEGREHRPGRSAGLAFVAVGVPTVLVAAIAVWLGAEVVGAVVSLLVLVTGVLFALGPVPVELERSMIRDSLDRGEPLTRAQVRRRSRRQGLEIGLAITFAGGLGLAISLAAL